MVKDHEYQLQRVESVDGQIPWWERIGIALDLILALWQSYCTEGTELKSVGAQMLCYRHATSYMLQPASGDCSREMHHRLHRAAKGAKKAVGHPKDTSSASAGTMYHRVFIDGWEVVRGQHEWTNKRFGIIEGSRKRKSMLESGGSPPPSG